MILGAPIWILGAPRVKRVQIAPQAENNLDFWVAPSAKRVQLERVAPQAEKFGFWWSCQGSKAFKLGAAQQAENSLDLEVVPRAKIVHTRTCSAAGGKDIDSGVAPRAKKSLNWNV